MHGYGIAVHIEQVSRDFLTVEEGSLYPELHRMELAGWIDPECSLTENKRRARYYRITAAEEKRLAEEEQNWRMLCGCSPMPWQESYILLEECVSWPGCIN
jgi:PadR family transcriptional regulator, regulatory protein PadR